MKSLRYQFIMLVIAALSGLLSGCSDNEDSRSYEPVSVVGVKVDGTLYQVNYSGDSAIVNLAAGVDLSSVKLQLLIANGTAPAFVNDNTYDARRPIDLSLKGYDGTASDVKLCVRSAPKLSALSIARLDVPAGNVYTSAKSVIVQVNPGTDLTALAVTMEFTNGTLSGFENGTVRDYTNPVSFSVLGVDGITVYPYQLIITTDPVGPATIKSMTINGLPTTKVEVSGTVVTPYVGSLTDLSSATVTIQTGYGNEIDPSFSGQGLNLLSGNNKVTITGTYGVTLSTPTGNLSASAFAGEETKVTMAVTNSGNVDLENLQLAAQGAAEWNIRFDETTIPMLEAGATKEITAYIQPAKNAVIGDYVTAMTVQNAQVKSEADLRISVKNHTTWGITAIAVIAVVCICIGAVIRRYGRR